MLAEKQNYLLKSEKTEGKKAEDESSSAKKSLFILRAPDGPVRFKPEYKSESTQKGREGFEGVMSLHYWYLSHLSSSQFFPCAFSVYLVLKYMPSWC